MKNLNLLGLIVSVTLTSAMCTALAATADRAPCKGCATPEQMKAFADWQQKQAPASVPSPAPAPVVVPTPAPPPPVAVAPPPAPAAIAAPASPVTVSSGPGGETTISVGTIAGQALSIILSILALPIGGYVVAILNRFLGNLKIPMTDAARARIRQTAVNAVNLIAATAPQELAGHGNVTVRNAALAQAVQYVQTHGADDIKKLGLDPTSPKAQEAIRAWIETVINDPTTPTNPVMDPPTPVATDPAATAKV